MLGSVLGLAVCRIVRNFVSGPAPPSVRVVDGRDAVVWKPHLRFPYDARPRRSVGGELVVRQMLASGDAEPLPLSLRDQWDAVGTERFRVRPEIPAGS